MKKHFEEMLAEAEHCASEVECRLRVVSTIRLLLQQTTYSLVEWISSREPDLAAQPDTRVIESLATVPADGDLVDALESLIISAEKTGWSGISKALTFSVSDRPASRICNGGPKTIMGLLRGLVFLRNDGAEGHGLIGGYERDAEVDALRATIEALSKVIPILEADGTTACIGADRLKHQLQFVRGWNGKPALIRRIKRLSAERVRVAYQVSDGPTDREVFNHESISPFQYLTGGSIPSLVIWENSWEPFCYLPDRATDSFTGRARQLEALTEWINDDGSRACLIHGDGGYGKTTLTIEFLHQVLDERISVEWKPSIVIFYTAKRWQWGVNGLEPISSGQPHLLELLALVHSLLFSSYPDDDFYKFDVARAASFLQGRISNELRIPRNEILLVIDNAETLIENEEERQTLGTELVVIARRIGRILLTSRRHELFEAHPIGMDFLAEQEAITYLRDRASKLGLRLINKASDEALLESLKKLERRPIVLEAFSGVLADPSVKKIEDAVSRVETMLMRDLGNFLFADAWLRLKPEVRRLLLLMTRVGDVHDEQLLKICSALTGVSVQSAEMALEETGGIASLTRNQNGLQVTFSKNFLEFAKDKTVALPDGTHSPSTDEVQKARSQYSTYIRGTRMYSGDRINQAFRTPQAKAAHMARKERNFPECKRLYEAAVLNDSSNGWLFDRYAYFLFHDLRDYPAALHQAKKAVELLPEEGEVWLTRCLIEAREGDVRACEISAQNAERLGVPAHRCSIQRAWAYLKTKPVQLGLAEKEIERLRAYSQSNVTDTRVSNELALLEGRLTELKAKSNKR